MFFSTAIMMFTSAKKRNVIYHTLDVRSLSPEHKKLKVFFISDIHRRKIDKALLKKVDKDIDIVIIGGDLAERGVSLSRISSNIRNLSKLGPLFYVWGNNDREVDEREIRLIMVRNGCVILENENFSIPGHPAWGISGTDDPSSGNVDLFATLTDIRKYKHLIFASHQPRILRAVEYYYRPNLLVAGHTHGGQIRIGKLGLTKKGEFRKIKGRGKLISNGYGTSKVPLRLGAPAQSHIITIDY